MMEERMSERQWLLTEAPEVQMVEDDGTLRITVNCGAFCRTHVSGIAPAEAGLVVRTGAGDVDVTGFQRGVDLTTSAGDVISTDIRGPVRLLTDAGWIRGLSAMVMLMLGLLPRGIDLEVMGEFSRISAVSDAGSVKLTVPDDVYRVEADTSAGWTQIDVATDPDTSREIVARSDAGNVTVDHFQG